MEGGARQNIASFVLLNNAFVVQSAKLVPVGTVNEPGTIVRKAMYRSELAK
jgi:hypothetical protein